MCSVLGLNVRAASGTTVGTVAGVKKIWAYALHNIISIVLRQIASLPTLDTGVDNVGY